MKIIDSKHFNSNLEYGNKSQGLLFLQKNGFKVPGFFLIDYVSLVKCIDKKFSIDKLCKIWIEEYKIDENSLWAVRSSTNAEDSQNESFAGLFESKINVIPNKLPEAISEVLNSYKNVAASLRTDINACKFGIIIQEMIQPDYSGVIFSHNPLNINESNVYINVIPGLGEKLVSGKETGMTIKSIKRKIIYPDLDETFTGEIFEGELHKIKKTGFEIKKELSPTIAMLVKGTKKLAKLKKQPVDIEFAIAFNKIYWLQVRPVSAHLQKTPENIWDNANIGENYPGLTLPLSISYVKYTYLNAYTAMASFLGMKKAHIVKNKVLFNNMVGGIYGALYYNITAWQQLLYQLPFGKKTSLLIVKLWGMDKAEFEKPKLKPSVLTYIKLLTHIFTAFYNFNKLKKNFEATFTHTLRKYQKPVIWTDFEADYDANPSDIFKGKNHAGLIKLSNELNTKLGSNWIVPVLNGFFAMLLFGLLMRIFRRSRLFNLYPNFINDILFSQGDVVSVVIVREFQNLIKTIAENKELSHLFKQKNEQEIIKGLELNFADFKQKILNYLNLYGERCRSSELKIETINYKEQPIEFITYLKLSLNNETVAGIKLDKFNYRTLIDHHYKYSFIKKWALLLLINAAINRIKDRENYRFYRTQGFHVIRNIFRAVDEYLFKKQFITEKNDSLYLTFDEICDLTLVEKYKTIIAARKQEYKSFNKLKRSNRYVEVLNNFTPVDDTSNNNLKAGIKGTGCCSGTLTEKVVVIGENNMELIEKPDGILVAKYFEPGWVNLFANAAGVISERGNLLGHTAILCREMGIPSIVGAKGILSQVKTGDLVQMNGSTGEIKILKHE